MTQPKIFESFNWFTKEAFTYQDAGRNKVRIRGIALKSDTVSRNMRHYIDEELVKSARTLIGKPININHDDKRIIGNVEWAEYENGALEYLGVVNKQPYTEYIRNNDSAVKGVSVQAKYLYNTCPKCGQRFTDEAHFTQHMKETEGILNFKWEPRGIIYDGLALVVAPETPGIADTTINLMETVGMSQLLETVTKEKQEELNLMEQQKVVSITPESRVAIGKSPMPQMIAEKEPEPQPQQEPKPEDKPEEKPAEQPATPKIEEFKGIAFNPITLKEIKLHEKLTLAEPCDWSKFGYSSFDDCVASNQDKGNPEAYCGSLKAKEKLEITRYNQVVEALNSIMETIAIEAENTTFLLNGLHETRAKQTEAFTETQRMIQALPKDDTSWKEHLEKHPQDDTSWKEAIENMDKTNKATLQEVKDNFGKLLEKADQNILEARKTFDERVTKLQEELKEKDSKLQETEKKLQETVARTDNLEDKQRPKFKGQAKALTTTALSETDSGTNPITGK